jgi:hypothetical protein
MAADDEAYGCVQLTEDDARLTGIRLKQELVSVAERALRQNMQDLGPLVLPLGEKLKFAVSYVARRLAKSGGGLAGVLPAGLVERQYVPDFKKAFGFFCIHTGELLTGPSQKIPCTQCMIGNQTPITLPALQFEAKPMQHCGWSVPKAACIESSLIPKPIALNSMTASMGVCQQ